MKCWLALIIVAVGACARAAETPLTLAADGRAAAVIAIGTAPSPAERFAAEELQAYLQRISDARLDIVADARAERTRILLGEPARAELVDGEVAGLGAEGFIIRTVGRDLVIAGSATRGTLYGVYSFLESLGCRWWAIDAETVPRRATITVAPTDRREVPKLVYRDVLYQEMWGANLWGVRNKITNMVGGASEIRPEWGGSGPVFHSSLVHSWRSLINEDGQLDYENKQGGADPSWYALVPDWRGDLQHEQVQPCTRHPQVREAILRGALKRLRDHPDDRFVTVGQEDGPAYCHCTEHGCAQLVEAEGSAAALVLDIANEAADRVAAEFPGKRVMAPAYAWGVRPPRNLRPRDNVMLAVAPIENDFGHPLVDSVEPANVAFREVFDQWSAMGRPIWVWDYTTNFTHYLMPQPNLDTLAANLKYYVDRGVTGYLAQGSHTCINAEFSQLRMWVLAKAMWDPEVDGRQLIEEFCRGYYGAAGEAILRYIDTIHRPVRADPRLKVACYNRFDAPWLAPEIMAEAEEHLRAAEAAVAGDPVLLERVKLATVPLRWVVAVRQPSSGTHCAIERRLGRLDPAAFARDHAAVVDRFFTATGRPWGLDESGGRKFEDYTAYLRAWADRVGRTGDVVPAELAGQTGYRLIRPWQIDQQNLAWGTRPFADETSTDGLVMRAVNDGWTMGYRFQPGDDFESGRRYRLFVRVQCPAPTGDGPAFSCGIYAPDPLPTIERTVTTAELTPEQWQVIEVGTIAPAQGHSFWICTSQRDGRYNVAEVRLDCLWLLEAD